MVYRVLMPDVSGDWREFTQPVDVFIASCADELMQVLSSAEKAAQQGKYVAGFVSYEAASGFDKSLRHHPVGELPLSVFAVFDDFDLIRLENSHTAVSLNPSVSRNSYETAFRRIHDYLSLGDTYQVNFTQQLKGDFSGDAEILMASLVRAQPTPYAMMLQGEDYVICSVSPELFFERVGQTIRTEPMKGTRPRGPYPEEDQRQLDSLRASEKDQAENLMIVDMIRNDLGRIAETGSVCVEDIFQVKKLPTVWQKISSVSASSSVDLAGIFSALFPCASVTGAPKARTMEIINELEVEARGVYTGAVGLLEPGGDCRFSVAIRTLVVDQRSGRASYGVGGGIVWDSDVEEEWQEALTKSRILSTHRPDFRLLETMKFEPGVGIVRLEYHLARLRRSADYFGYEIPETIIRARLSETSFDEPRKIRLLLDEAGHLTLEDTPLPESAAEVRLRVARTTVNSSDVFLFHKTSNRDVYEQARASVTDCDDVLLFNERGELTETSIANLFLDMGGELLTPAVSCGLLAGTLRQEMLDTGQAREAILTLEDLGRCQRVLVGNSLRGLRQAKLLMTDQ